MCFKKWFCYIFVLVSNWSGHRLQICAIRKWKLIHIRAIGAKKFWAQHEMNVTKHLENVYGSGKVGEQITVDVFIQGNVNPVRCRIDNLIDLGNGTFRIADGKSSIINDLSKKTAEELLNSMSTVNQKTFYQALKDGTVTQIVPAGNRAQLFLGSLNPIQVEKSIDFFVNDVSTNGYSIFIKTLVQ